MPTGGTDDMAGNSVCGDGRSLSSHGLLTAASLPGGKSAQKDSARNLALFFFGGCGIFAVTPPMTSESFKNRQKL